MKQAALSASLPPSMPIKAVFLQQILSWWRQPLRALEVKSHRACMADGLSNSMCRREKAAKKETNKHKNGSLSPARRLLFSTQFTTHHFQIFKLFLKNAVKPVGDQGKQKVLFCGEFFCTHQDNSNISIYKNLLRAAWFGGFDQLSQLTGSRLCFGLLLQWQRQ